VSLKKKKEKSERKLWSLRSRNIPSASLRRGKSSYKEESRKKKLSLDILILVGGKVPIRRERFIKQEEY